MSENKEKPYLVTGGCGFVGRHLIKKLINNKRDIWIIDNLFTGKHPELWLGENFKKISTKGNITLYRWDYRNIYFVKSDLIEFLMKEIVDLETLPYFSDVFHLASVVGGRELIDEDPILVAKDLAIDSVFFLWATRNPKRTQKILYASSSAAYPIDIQNNKEYIALKEEMVNFNGTIGLPDMTYGWSKLTGEYLSRLTHSKYGLHIACARPFSGYGEDQDLSYPIPAIALRVAKRENPLTVWGTGQQGRDFVHIDDCIDALFLILDKVKDGSGYNIGSGKILSFLEVLTIFTNIEGYTPKIEPLVKKPVGVHHRYSDTKLISTFGWKTTTSPEEGFAKVLVTAKNTILRELLKQTDKNGNGTKKSNNLTLPESSEFLLR